MYSPMRPTLLILTLIACAVFLSPTTLKAQAVMTFDTTHHDFGKVKAGKKAVHVYKFKNTGDRDLVIREVKTTCGCTVAEFPRKPIAPGKKGKIVVAFDTKEKNGPYVKGVNVHHNGGVSNLIVYIEVLGEPLQEEIEYPEEEEKPQHRHDP